jgi:hypothetical protein
MAIFPSKFCGDRPNVAPLRHSRQTSGNIGRVASFAKRESRESGDGGIIAVFLRDMKDFGEEATQLAEIETDTL